MSGCPIEGISSNFFISIRQHSYCSNLFYNQNSEYCSPAFISMREIFARFARVSSTADISHSDQIFVDGLNWCGSGLTAKISCQKADYISCE